MMIYLFVVSLILHFITFFILILLAKKLRTTVDYEQLEAQKKEIEDLLAFYAVELKEENERFLQQLQKTEEIVQQTDNEESEPVVKDALDKHQPQMITTTNNIENKKPVMKEPSIDDDKYELSLEAQALQLHAQGYTHEEIAKRLNKGHGEIELLLKFHQSK